MDKKKRVLWKFLFVLCILVGGCGLLLPRLMPVVIRLMFSDAASIGIIGGADGPTAIILASTVRPVYSDLVLTALLLAGVWGIWRLWKRKKT